jgi:hypothetical protein
MTNDSRPPVSGVAVALLAVAILALVWLDARQQRSALERGTVTAQQWSVK